MSIYGIDKCKSFVEITAEKVGARPDTWTPTAEQVGARPNTWTPTPSDVGAAKAEHVHDAEDISSGIFPVARGGTGASTLASGEALIGNGTNAVGTRAISNLTAKGALTGSTNLATANAVVYHAQNRLNRTTAVNAADTAYTTYMARAIAANTSAMTAGSTSLTSGSIYLQYT